MNVKKRPHNPSVLRPSQHIPHSQYTSLPSYTPLTSTLTPHPHSTPSLHTLTPHPHLTWLAPPSPPHSHALPSPPHPLTRLTSLAPSHSHTLLSPPPASSPPHPLTPHPHLHTLTPSPRTTHPFTLPCPSPSLLTPTPPPPTPSQVSHHPPMFAMHVEHKDYTLWEEYTVASKFRGKYLVCYPIGHSHIVFHKSGNHYTWNKVVTTIHNIIIGKLWIDQVQLGAGFGFRKRLGVQWLDYSLLVYFYYIRTYNMFTSYI